MKTCGSCVYFDSNKAINICRYNAPMPANSGSASVIWPQVDPVNDWCADGFNPVDGAYDPLPIRG